MALPPRNDPQTALVLPHLVRHDSGHGPADLVVLMGFSFRSKQNKEEPGQENQREREDRARAQRAPTEVPRSSQPRERLKRGREGSPTARWS